jgi:hypothetical protein
VSLFKDKIEQGWVNSCAVKKADTSYFYHSTWVHSALFNLVFEQWHDGCPQCSRNFLPLSQHMSSLNLVQSSLWTVTRWLSLVQQKLHPFIVCCTRAPIMSLFKDKIEQGWVNSCAVIKVRSFCCTRDTHRVTVQRQDWTRLSELMCCDKGKKLLLH